MLICSLRSSFVLLLVVPSICQGRAQQSDSGATQNSSNSNGSSAPPIPFIVSTDPLPLPNVSFNSSSSTNTPTEVPAAVEAPAPPPAVLLPTASGACPARLLTLLQEQPNKQQPAPRAAAGNITVSATKQSVKISEEEPEQQQPASQDELKQQLPVWPPVPLRSGLTCTMEVSHLAVAMPGSADVCSAFRIRNNLMSALYSWQLVWEPGAAGGLLAAGADGAVVIANDPDGDAPVVRVINAALSPEIAAEGGSADFMVQMVLPNSSDSSSSSSASGKRLRISPGIASVYLNGLQCTRLPLVPSGGTGKEAPGSQDCTSTRWSVSDDGLFRPLPDSSNNSSSSSSSSSNATDVALEAALSFLSCSAHYCCGLQVTPSSTGAPADGGATVAMEPSIAAFDGPGPGQVSSNVTPVKQVLQTLNVTGAARPTDAPPRATNRPTGAAAANLASANDSSALPMPAEVPATVSPAVNSSSGRGDSSSSRTGNLLAAVLSSVIGVCAAAAVVTLLVVRQRRSKAKQRQHQLQQLHKPEPHLDLLPNLATTALVRAISSASTDSSGSQAAVAAGGSTHGGSSTGEWQQHAQQRLRTSPYHTALTMPVGASDPMPGGSVWRSGSWQGPERVNQPPPGQPLFRSVSGPHALLQHQQSPPKPGLHPFTTTPGAGTTTMPTAPAAALGRKMPPLPSHATSGSSITAKYAEAQDSYHRTSAGVPDSLSRLSSSHSHAAVPAAAASSGGESLHRGASGVSCSSQSSSIAMAEAARAAAAGGSSALAGQSTGGSTWGSLRRFFGNTNSSSSSNKLPKSSVASPGSSMVSALPPGALSYGSNASTAVAISMQQQPLSRQQQLSLQQQQPAQQAQLVSYHQQLMQQQHLYQTRQQQQQYQLQHLQLIQETAPLPASQLAAAPAGQLLSSLQLSRMHATGPTGQLQTPGGQPLFPSGAELMMSSISRRISPILSVFEDGSSATSNDSFAGPAAWHLADRQMLEDTPGWLNIDFAREVRLERKLGEGGFGQVFCARWRTEVIAVKLVPFMSLVAHTSLPVNLVSADQHANSSSAAASPRPLGSAAAAAASPSTTAAADSVGVGMQFSAASLRAIKMEIKVLSQLSHPSIVAFKGACLAPPHICILEELAEGGSLHGRLYSRSSRRAAPPAARSSAASAAAAAAAGELQAVTVAAAAAANRRRGRSGSSSAGRLNALPLSVLEVLRIAIDVASAMQYLHNMQPQVVHRDLKPQNVLLDMQGRAKVCDFGISKMKDASLAASSTRLQAGTPAYMAPEQFEGCSATEKVDVFSFAVLLWECCEQQQPWRDLSPMQIIYAVGLQKERLKRPGRCPDGLWQLVEACWQQQPEARPSFQAILHTLKQLETHLLQQ